MAISSLVQDPFFKITLPIVVTFVTTIWLANWSQNKRFEDFKQDVNRRFDETNKRLDEIIKRLDRIDFKLEDHHSRIVRLEERTSIVRGS